MLIAAPRLGTGVCIQGVWQGSLFCFAVGCGWMGGERAGGEALMLHMARQVAHLFEPGTGVSVQGAESMPVSGPT